MAGPTNTTAPLARIPSALAYVGEQATISHGGWSPKAQSFAYQWKRGGSAISGATGVNYIVTAADIGATLVCTVTATNAGGSTPADSNAIAGPIAARPATIPDGGSPPGEQRARALRIETMSPTDYLALVDER